MYMQPRSKQWLSIEQCWCIWMQIWNFHQCQVKGCLEWQKLDPNRSQPKKVIINNGEVFKIHVFWLIFKLFLILKCDLKRYSCFYAFYCFVVLIVVCKLSWNSCQLLKHFPHQMAPFYQKAFLIKLLLTFILYPTFTPNTENHSFLLRFWSFLMIHMHIIKKVILKTSNFLSQNLIHSFYSLFHLRYLVNFSFL